MKTLIKWIKSHSEIVIIGLLACFFMICFAFASRIDVQKRNNDLIQLKKKLDKEISSNKKLKDDISTQINHTLDEINNKKIDTIKQTIIIKQKSNEVKINSIKHLSTDSTIGLLSDYLSK